MTGRVITIAGYAIIIATLFGLEIAGRRKTAAIPTLGQVLSCAMRPRTGRLLILAGWLWLGWHFFAR